MRRYCEKAVDCPTQKLKISDSMKSEISSDNRTRDSDVSDPRVTTTPTAHLK